MAKPVNILVNASNQANIARSKDIRAVQMNAVFIVVSPYRLEKFSPEGMDLSLRVDEDGGVWVNHIKYETKQVAEGIRMFGIIRR